MFNIDGTLIVQIVNFLLLLLILNFILFRPIRRVLARRNEEMNSSQKTIDDFQDQAEKNEKGIEEGVIQARKEGHTEKEALRSQGLEEEKGILQEAGGGVEQKLNAAKKEIESKIAVAREALEGQVPSFSDELAQKILGRSIQ
jgi:F-type H+-transporting ATPase subunit b